jgi:hypothetical protein
MCPHSIAKTLLCKFKAFYCANLRFAIGRCGVDF